MKFEQNLTEEEVFAYKQEFLDFLEEMNDKEVNDNQLFDTCSFAIHPINPEVLYVVATRENGKAVYVYVGVGDVEANLSDTTEIIPFEDFNLLTDEEVRKTIRENEVVPTKEEFLEQNRRLISAKATILELKYQLAIMEEDYRHITVSEKLGRDLNDDRDRLFDKASKDRAKYR